MGNVTISRIISEHIGDKNDVGMLESSTSIKKEVDETFSPSTNKPSSKLEQKVGTTCS